jgi:iron complex outermembrane receptor protein
MRKHLLALAVVSAPYSHTVMAEDTAELDTVRVTATPTQQSPGDIAQPSLVLSGEQLGRQRAASLGETLAQQPGVSNASFGAAVGRPVIRGLGGARVKILQSGMEAMDASSVSPDHAVAVHTHGARQIEVLRGPASLLYGNGAFGGVVNVVDDRIPHADQHSGAETEVRVGLNSVNDGREIALRHEGKRDQWHWHVDGSQVSSDDYRIPKDAGEVHQEDNGEIEHHDAEGKRLDNSDIDHNRQLTLGGSYELSSGGHLGVAVSRMEAQFGLPGHGHEEEHEEEVPAAEEHHEEEGPARVEAESNRIDLDALLVKPFTAAKSLSVHLALSDYEHTEGHEEVHSEEEQQEAEHEEHAPTTFKNKAQDLRMELVLEEWAGVQNVVGTQLTQKEFSAIGGEALVPKTDSQDLALFWLGETQWGETTLELGARLDRLSHDPVRPAAIAAECGFAATAVERKDFSNHSVSFGLIQPLTNSWQLAAALTSAQRAPATEELFSCGAHESTLSYDIGNPDLKEEQALNLDLSLRKNSGRFTAALTVYRNQIDDFIYQNAVVEAGTLLQVDELQAYRFEQDRATLNGAELQLGYYLASNWQLTAIADTVRGKLDNGDYLPRMPADRMALGVNFQGLSWSAFAQHQLVAKQDRVATFGRAIDGTELTETETEGYQQLNAGVSYRIDSATAEYRLDLMATNLLNEAIRYHTSFVKDQVAQPGRGFKLGLNARF